MNRIIPATLLLAIAWLSLACGSSSTASNSPDTKTDPHSELRSAIKSIEPFFRPMGKPQPYDWLATFKEPGQTFDEYIASNPTLPTAERSVIYVQPLGRLRSDEAKVVRIAAEYLEAFYGLKVKTLPPQSLPAKLAAPDQRTIDYPPHRQLRTGWVMDAVLKPKLPPDAAAFIAFTGEDLYPDASMTFVFGQANLEDRVGVWSFFRLDEQADFDKFLRRTLKISTHEVGHMFSFRHCTKYECVMSGTNLVLETDRRPIDACPECMAKIAWMRRESPRTRYDRLIKFTKKHRLTPELNDFTNKSAAVK